MELITSAPSQPAQPARVTVPISVDRLTLAKRRWRGVAADGREFGFDLEHALEDGALVFAENGATYQIAQKSEPVLTVALHGAEEAARLGWLLGNLHFRLAVAEGAIQAPDDPAVRQMFDREHVHYHATEAVFRPVGGGHSHGHGAH